MKFLSPVISLILCLFILFSACDTKSDFSGNINTDVNSDSRIGDSLALVELYNKCNGPVWKTTWDLSEPINNWYGIYLKYGRVVYVNLDDNNLSGTLPDDIANISELEHLYLNNNNLSGELPSFISRMKKLITLYLGENYFTGTITQEYIDFASKMNTRLRIDANFITGNVPEGMIYENINTTYRYQYHTKDINKENRLIDILQTISCNQADSLALNALYEANPEAFDWNTAEYVSGWCNRDIILTIKDNKLFVSGIEIYNVESIPEEIKNLKHIKSLVLNYYFRTGFQEVILELSSLEYLKMFGTGIKEIPQNIDKLTELTYLYLYDFEMTNKIPSSICNLSKLQGLYINGNLTGEIPENIGRLSNLNYLCLRGLNLTGNVPVSIENLKNLEFLDLSYNNLNGYFPFEHLKNTKLNYLDISSNIFDGKITDDIGNITGLIHAYLRNNKFSGNIPSEIGNLKNLKFLDLSHNDINGEIPKSMKQLTGLLDFNAAYTNLSGDLPDFLGIMPNLTFLDLRDCRFTGTIPKNYLRGWWSINLNYNFLTGPVPKNIDNYIPNIFYISQYSVNDINKEFGICDIGETKNGSSRISKKESYQKEIKDDDIKRKDEIRTAFEERIKSQIRF